MYVLDICLNKKKINNNKEEFEDTKGVIRIRISKKNRNTMAKIKSTNNDL
jgi:hypothetical protein